MDTTVTTHCVGTKGEGRIAPDCTAAHRSSLITCPSLTSSPSAWPSSSRASSSCTGTDKKLNWHTVTDFYINVSITIIVSVWSPNSMSKTFGQSFRINKSNSILTMKVFCSWDFKVIKKKSIEIMSENIYTQLKVRVNTHVTLNHTVDTEWRECADFKQSLCSASSAVTVISPSHHVLLPHQELLAELDQNQGDSSLCQRFWRLMVHGVAWTICIASTVGCVIGIYYFSEFMHQVRPGRLPSLVCYNVFDPYVS